MFGKSSEEGNGNMKSEFAVEAQGMLESIIGNLVDKRDEVHVSLVVDGPHTTVFNLDCAEDDLGKVIGRRGKTVSAIRTLLGSIASKHNRRVVLDIIEP